MKIRKLAASTIWASVWFMFVAACLYCFLLFPAKTVTLVGSSAHWKAENVVHVQKTDSNFRTSSVDELKVWWMGTPGEFSGVQYEISGLHGTMMKGNGASGSFNPWVIHLTDILLSEPQLEYGLVVTITLNGSTETIHLQRQ